MQTLLPELPSTGFIRAAQLIPGIIPISEPTLYRWVREGRFPRPVKLGPRCSAWSVESIRAWAAERAAS